MNTPLDLALRNWRTGLHPVHLDRLVAMTGMAELTPGERTALGLQLASASAHGVLLDRRCSWHLIETEDRAVYLVEAGSLDEACSIAEEETGSRCSPPGPRTRPLVAKVLVQDRT